MTWLSAVTKKAVDESLLLERCRQGDEVALRTMISNHRARLIRTASNILRDSNEAEDVAQETFLKALRELHGLRDDRAFSGYLYRICVRLCMDRLRARRAEPCEFDYPSSGHESLVENKVVVERLLQQLTPDLRTTLVLREMEQLSYEEISQIMHVPVGTVRSRLHAARERFRSLYLHASR